MSVTRNRRLLKEKVKVFFENRFRRDDGLKVRLENMLFNTLDEGIMLC